MIRYKKLRTLKFKNVIIILCQNATNVLLILTIGGYFTPFFHQNQVGYF